jgi:hypothetical protein
MAKEETKSLKDHINLQEASNKKVRDNISLMGTLNSTLKSYTKKWKKHGKQQDGYKKILRGLNADINKTNREQESALGTQKRLTTNALIAMKERVKLSGKLTEKYKETGAAIGQAWDPKLMDTFNNLAQDYENLKGTAVDLSDIRTQGLSDALDLYDEVLANAETIGSEEFKIIDVNRKIASLKREYSKQQDKDQKLRIMQEIAILDSAQAQNLALKAQHDIITTTEDKFDSIQKSLVGMLGKIPIFGDMIAKNMAPKLEKLTEGMKKNFMDGFKSGGKEGKGMAAKVGSSLKAMGPIGMAAIGLVIAAIAKMVVSMAKFANETGLSYAQTVKLGGALAINAEGVKAIADEFGNINNITTKMAFQMQVLNKQFGISATASAKLLKLQTATSGLTNEQLLTQQKQVAQMARLEGVSPAAVFESMAADSEAFAKFTKDSGKNLMKMAIQAKKMGVEMSSILGAMESSLDLESSINAQFEASVLLGRQINLDKFRQLSLAGDTLGAQKEIVQLVGSENEWNRMNIIQRNALAKAVGMQVSEVSKVVGAQKKMNSAIEEGQSQAWKYMAIGAAIGAVLLGVVAAILAATYQKGQIKKMIGGGIAGVAIGAGIGAAGGGVYSAMSAGPPVSGATMNPGTVANVRRGEMTIHKGETAVRTQDFNMMPMIEELKALRKDMRVGSTERAEQSRQQINTIRGIGAANA